MAEDSFSVDFSGLIQQLNEAKKQVTSLGKTLQTTQTGAENTSKAFGTYASSITKMMQEVRKQVLSSASSTSGLVNTVQMLGAASDFAQFQVVSNLQKIALQTAAVTNSTHELHQVMRDSSAMQMMTRHTLALANADLKLVLEGERLEKQRRQATTKQDSYNAAIQRATKLSRDLRDAEASLQDTLKRKQRELELVNSADWKAVQNTNAKIQSARALTTAETAQQAQLEKLRQTVLAYDGSLASQIRAEERALRVKQAVDAQNSQVAVGIAKVRAELSQLDSAEAKQLNGLRTSLQVKRQAIDLENKLRIERAKQRAVAKQLSSEEFAQVDQTRRLNTLRREAVTLKNQLALITSKEYKEVAKLRQELNSLASATNAANQSTITKTRNLINMNQVAASARATFSALRTSFGMYTSSTILAATATYGIVRAMRTGVDVGIEFTTAMARTQAIMASGVGSDTLFTSLDKQVRLLGQTTQFTSAQVAEATTELGMAGLSAGQSLIALRPALDLAIIGNLSMAETADHATNIMMMFGKEASDLTNIVDVMATAITNSNTNMQQLANSLTYAGPAAQTLGISLEDTTAAIEALANSGFKGSRSGTALRRMFVNLANPTAKGKAFLDEFGISITNIDGSTKSLTTIIRSLSSALNTLGGGADKLSVIKDLFGVYASAPMAALMEQVDNFEMLRLQLDDTAGAAERMRQQIEQPLEFDLKRLKSAFQDMQISVFENNQDQFKVWTYELIGFINTLSAETENGRTVLENMMTTVGDLAKSLVYLWATYKGATVLSRLTVSATSSDGQIKKLTQSLKQNRSQMLANIAAWTTGSTSLGGLASQSRVTTGSLAMGFARALPVIGGVATAVTLAYGAYSTYQSFASTKLVRTQDEVTAATARTRRELERLKAVEEERARRQEANIRNEQINSIQEEIKALARMRLEYEKLNEIGTEQTQQRAVSSLFSIDMRTSELEATLAGLAKQEEDAYFTELNKELRAADQALATMTGRLQTAGGVVGDFNSKYAELFASVEQVSGTEGVTSIWEQLGGDTLLNNLQQAYLEFKAAKDEVERLEEAVGDAGKGTSILYEDFIRLQSLDVSQLYDSLNAGLAGEGTGQHEVLTASLQRYSDALAEATLLEETLKGQALNTSAQEGVAAYWDRVRSAMSLYYEARGKYEKTQEKFETMQTENMRRALDDAEHLRLAQAELVKVQRDLAVISKEHKAGEITDLEEGVNLLEKERALLNEIARLRRGSGGGDDYERAKRTMLQMVGAYDQLAQKDKQYQENLKLTNKHISKLAEELKVSVEYLRLVQQAVSPTAIALAELGSRYNPTSAGIKELWDDLRLVQGELGSLEQTYSDLELAIDSMSEAERQAAQQRLTEIGQSISRYRDLEGQIKKTQDEQFRNRMSNPGGGYGVMGFAESLVGNDDRREEARKAFNEVERLEKEEHLRTLALMEANARAAGDAAYAQWELDRAQVKKRFQTQEENTAKQHQDQLNKIGRDGYMQLAGAAMNSLSQMAGAIESMAEEGSKAQVAAFYTQKALAAAQIIMYSHVLAYQAPLGMQPWIIGMGYADAALVMALSVVQQNQAKKSKSTNISEENNKANYAGAFDKGGYIPSGQFGIVGEYGPEIVNGPAHVTGREATARKLDGGGGVVISPNIEINYTSDKDSETSEKDATMMGNTIKSMVVEVLANELRPNGMLHRANR